MGTRATTLSSRRHSHAHLLVLCILTALSLAHPATAQPATKKLKLLPTETSFGKLPAGARGDQLFFSPDGRHVAAVVRRPEGALAWIDGVEGKLQEWILPSSLVWSPDGSRLAYNVQRGESLLVVIGTEEQKPCADVSHVTFSPDGKRFAYSAKLTANSSGVSIILDGVVQGAAYPVITPRSLTFSPDAKRFAYRVETAAKQFWVIDGKEMPQHERVGPITFSKDGTRSGYSAGDGNAHRIVTERPNWPNKSYDAAGGVSFSPDGKRMAYAARRGNREFIVIDDAEGKEYDRVAEPLFNAAGTRVAYEAVREKLAVVVIDGKEQTGYDAVSEARFSDDGNHLGYRAVRDGKVRLVIDGKESEPYDRIHAWLMNDDASRVAFSARIGEEDFLVLDGKRLPGPGHLTMSPQGKYVAHSRVVPADKTTVLMVNETDGPAYDGFLAGSRWAFTAPNKLTCMAARKGEIVRVEVEIVED